MPVTRNQRYTSDEIIKIVKSNRGYGLDRLIKKIYFEEGTKKSQKQSRYYFDTLVSLNNHKDTTGEDLYSWIEDPEMTKMVTREMYLSITGNKQVPSGSGRSQGGRTSKPKMKGKSGEHMFDVPLPPQDFDWAEVIPIWGR